MKTTRLAAALLAVVAIAIFAADASAYYHPTMGRFISRDPGPGSQARTGAGGAAPTSRFIPRDPTGSNQYRRRDESIPVWAQYTTEWN